IGAFAIGLYAEGVAVMLFYTVGELFQDAAVGRSKKNIQSLLDKRSKVAHVLNNGKYHDVDPEQILIGDIIQVKAGEQVPLDGILLNDSAYFDTSALTGESKPKTIYRNEMVLAGMISINQVLEIEVQKKFVDSSFARIYGLIQSALTHKAPTELFIRKFAEVYTPIVVLFACLLVGLPYFFFENYSFNDWLYRALIFLVVSCPCALVISIPLGYFGGIGAASRNGILFKGSNYLDLIGKVDAIVFDKTGTLTEGIFKVRELVIHNFDRDKFLQIITAIETTSNHPIAKAIKDYFGENSNEISLREVKEFPGEGLQGVIDGKDILVGNSKLMNRFGVDLPHDIRNNAKTLVIVSFKHEYIGHLVIDDVIKPDAKSIIKKVSQLGVRKNYILSGDRTEIVKNVASEIGVNLFFGDLLPDQKMQKLSEIKKENKIVAFVGDGINDAPALALSDIGISMGALGSDVAIETANVVIQTDQLSKIVTAIKIGLATKKIVWQNITLAFTVKLIVLSLGAFGLATMWEAVFADVGVALLAIANAVRIQHSKF
ncbi:MAG TPA: cadmium-translocating P-type ATPase, partial [Cytophagales bacterium]|nr:cadmium-translocating P-type ATPase [Cytophagales bacterium]